MDTLMKVEVNEKQEQIVSARTLYYNLGIKERFSLWWERNAKSLGLKEDISYCRQTYTNTNNQDFDDYAIPIDIAKHICMVSGGEKAWEIRDYFIKLEKAWNTPEAVMARALKMADTKILEYRDNIIQLEDKIEEQKPKVLFADAVSTSKSTVLVGELAKILKQNGIKDMGQNRLFAWLRKNGFLIKRNGADYNMPTQKSMELELMEVKITTINNPDGSIRVSKTPKVTGKGQIYFVNKFKEKGIA